MKINFFASAAHAIIERNFICKTKDVAGGLK